MEKIILFTLIICLINQMVSKKSNNSTKTTKFSCSAGKKKYEPKSYPLSDEEKENILNKRKLDSENDYNSIRIYLSTVYITKQVNYSTGPAEIISYLNTSTNILSKLIKVKRRENKISVSSSEQNSWGLSDVDKYLHNGVYCDLVVIPRYSTSESNIEIKYTEQITNRPIVAILYIQNFIGSNKNKNKYYEILLLHELTHILGFLYDSFQYFPGGLSKTVKNVTNDRTKTTKLYVITDKVKELAQKYYGCKDIIGLELEDQEKDNIKRSSHWEARILLGEYMNSEPYTTEQVISEFTLALLEDSGWYQVNYYTGGLMRFGKNKGCDFLNKDCISSDNILFANEFFHKDDVNKPSCSSGRLGRSYCHGIEYSSLPEKYQRINNKESGIEIAEYCLAFQESLTETNDIYYVGNCKIGTGDYGNSITYHNGQRLSNGELDKELGEKYSDNSFCVLSSFYPPSKSDVYQDIIHPMCYPMTCTNYSLTIQIYNQYIVCPRSGGKVEVNGDYTGYILCPDYNLICTGTVMCNDMFDCVDKSSIYKNGSYEYEIITSQITNMIEYELPIISYELTDKGICPINCNQCKANKKCFKCRENYNLIGTKENDNEPINCDNEIDISIHYYKKDNVNYPCINYCNICNNQTICIKCDDIHKTNKDKTECIDKVEHCQTYTGAEKNFTCTKCKGEYVFLKEDRENCIIINDKSRYFTLDNGISYYPCDTNISYCYQCSNKADSCSKCITNYYFIKEDRKHCVNDKNLTKYYTLDNGTSYYLCDDAFKYCDKCPNNKLCDICIGGYYFIAYDRTKCRNDVNISKYFTLDNETSYFPCDTNISHCDECSNKDYECTKCKTNYYFIKENRKKCETGIVKDNNYYTEDGGISYYPCDTYKEGCDTCSNRTNCLSCKTYYYLMGYDNKCYYNITIKKYYHEGNLYYPCNTSIIHCDECSVKESCEKCDPTYYFIADDRKNCKTGEDLKKYYTNDNGISYYLCSSKMTYCVECYNENHCAFCESTYFLKYEEPNTCFPESTLSEDDSYYKLNNTHYKKCSDTINNCEKCTNSTYCKKCSTNFYFVNDNHKECIDMTPLLPGKEYYKFDDENYYSCDRGVQHCKQCENAQECIICKSDYAFVEDEINKCYSKESLSIGYYHNKEGTHYYHCFENCDYCVDKKTCEKCSSKFTLLLEGLSCEFCQIKRNNTEEKLNIDNINKFASDYINEHGKQNSVVTYYIHQNYTATIYKSYECTDSLLSDYKYKIDTTKIAAKLKKVIPDSSYFVFCIINYNYKTDIEVYESNGNRIDIEYTCPGCLTVQYEITNNFSRLINQTIGSFLSNIVQEKKINIFDSKDPYFNDICNNLMFEKIDVPIEQRRSIFYLGNMTTKLACLDNNCEIKLISTNDFIAKCQCNVRSDFNELFDDSTNTVNLETSFETISKSNPFPVYQCINEGFDTGNFSSNTGFCIGVVFISIQIVSFISASILFCVQPKIPKNIANPPLDKKALTLRKNIIYHEDDVKETQEKETKTAIKDIHSHTREDPEKIPQKKDEDIDREIKDYDGVVYKSQNTEVASDERNFLEKNKNLLETRRYPYEDSSDKKINFGFEKDFNGDEGANYENISYKDKGKKNVNNNKKNNNNNNDNESLKVSSINRKVNSLSENNENSSSRSHSISPSENDVYIIAQKLENNLDYLSVEQKMKNDQKTFCQFYAYLLGLKQPIINIFSFIQQCEIADSFIPLPLKLIKFFFFLSLNIFINSLFLTQKYFQKKYEYFNDLYEIQYKKLEEGISSNERFSYALKHTIANASITFAICFVIQFIINYFCFNIRTDLRKIKKNKKKRRVQKTIDLFSNARKRYIILSVFNFILMAIFFLYIVNFSAIYEGGVIDYIGGAFWTFILLQFIPFVICLIFTIFREIGLKINSIKLYALSQFIIY